MALFKISKGSKNNLPSTLTEGYCWYTFEDSKFYIDHKDENGVLVRKALNADNAETLCGKSLDEIKAEIMGDIDIPSEYVTETELNNKGYLTSYTETDPTVPSWAKAASKPTYTAAEVGALPATTKVPTKVSELTNDKGYITNAPDEIYVGNGDMPEDATIQIIMDGSDDEEALKDDLKEYIDYKVDTHNAATSSHIDIREQISQLSSEIEIEVESQLDGAKADFVAELIAQLGGMPVFGTVNDDMTITVTSTLADGTYTLMYTDAEGNLAEIGTITVDNNAETYINLVPTSIDFDGEQFWSEDGTTKGYQNDAYLSSSTGKPSGGNTGYVSTGYMELGYEWYMKGATWAADSKNRIMWYNDSFALNASNAYVTGAAMGSGVTVTDMGNGVTKFTVSQNWATINGYKYVRMSLTGTGENLIISETPIE